MHPDESYRLELGDHVTVPHGLYAGLEGRVLEVHTVSALLGRARLRLAFDDNYWHPFWNEPMTEAEWLSSTDTARLERFLARLEPPPSPRQWRLYACACLRRVWQHIEGTPYRWALELSERYADGKATWEEVLRISRELRVGRPEDVDLLLDRQVSPAHCGAAQYAVRCACLMTNPIEEVRMLCCRAAGRLEEADAQRQLLRDIAGNPFCSIVIDPAWRAGPSGHIARDIYDRRAFREMPVLGDALEDAGCTDEAILSHCRSTRLHTRGCWLLDALLDLT
jgi:hypothetical protein